MNQWIGIGNLTRDPELRYTNSGTPVVTFSIAVNEGTGEKRITTYLNCVAWQKLAEIIDEFCETGTRVFVLGKVVNERWTTKEGEQRQTNKIRVSQIQFLERPKRLPDAEDDDLEFDDIDGHRLSEQERDLARIPF